MKNFINEGIGMDSAILTHASKSGLWAEHTSENFEKLVISGE